MVSKIKALFLLTFMLCSTQLALASHIRAGDITAQRISQTSYTYRFTFTIYFDTVSPARVGDLGVLKFGESRTLDAGVNGGPEWLRTQAESFQIELLGNDIGKVTMVFIHTFPGPGVYSVSYFEQFRNANILNINGGASDMVAFFMETTLKIDPAFFNNTPVLTIDPIDRGCVGSKFIHNPGAFDADGDSLAYKIVTPKMAEEEDVANYASLDDGSISTIKEDGSGPALFEIDPITGTLTWDSPMLVGEHNTAFIVEEWRYSEFQEKWVLLGYVTRDMQILVEDCDNERPELIVPDEICVEAGTLIQLPIIAIDPDSDDVQIEAFGGSFEQNISPSILNPEFGFRPQPATSIFEWQTDISHVREKPYDVIFKVSDQPEDPRASLVDFKTWQVKVVAPAPKGLLSSILTARSIQLVWDEYVGKDYEPVMQVWRKEEGYEFDAENCLVGIPDNSGYTLIETLPIDDLSYLDDEAIRPGVKYCYRLVAVFPLPKGGESYASFETCVTVPLDVPAITNVSVRTTDNLNGEIDVKWTPPLEIDQNLFPPPYRYELIRFSGLSGTQNRFSVASTNDTTFTDIQLNTLDLAYHYRVLLYDSGDNLIDSSAAASSVRLESTGLLQSVELNWTAIVPWSNRVQEFPYHYIYRNRTDPAAQNESDFDLIDSVKVTTQALTYLDQGQFNSVDLLDDREYCYRVTTQGSYGNSLILDPLINFSQKICVQPSDSIPPPDPVVVITNPIDTVFVGENPLILVENENCSIYQNVACNFLDYSNSFSWTSENPDVDIARYNIYFSATGEDDSFNLVGTSTETQFTHTGLASFKGCYRVSAVDRSNNESGLSETICFDNCPYYELPNAFTPNGDGVNDTFTAFDQPNTQCPRFVENVQVKVFGRWGGQPLFTFNSAEQVESSLFIDWDGRDNNGNILPSGTYYYHAIVTFNVFDPEKRVQEFKNWVKIIRQE